MPAVLRHPDLRAAIDRAFALGVTQTADVTLHVPVPREVHAAVVPMDPPIADGGRAVVVLSDRTRERAVERMRADFVANVSHELRTPLNAILGFSELLELGMAGALEPRQAEYIGLIRQSGDHLHQVINDILDLAKIGAGKLELHEEQGIDPRHIVDACIAIMQERARLAGLRLSAASEDVRPVLVADATRLKQILLNLISNAVKFTGPGGSVAVTVHRTGDGGVAFEVKDTGVGMNAAEIEIALESFGQVDAGLGRRHEGTGLGLPLARRLAELHGGALHIDSEKDRGTTVTVTLPAARASDQSGAVLSAEPLAGAA
jgi:signal transduction histidine kinase